jgi:hypothetical protein
MSDVQYHHTQDCLPTDKVKWSFICGTPFTPHIIQSLSDCVYHSHYLSLSWARSVQSMPPHPLSLGFILMSTSHICLGFLSVSFSQVLPSEQCLHLSSSLFMSYVSPISFLLIDLPNYIWWGVQIMILLIMQFPPGPCYLILLSTQFSNISSLYSFLCIEDQVSHPQRTTREIRVPFFLIVFLGSK